MLTEMICAGFGGQGVLTTGSLIAYCAFDSGKIFTWYPSYGSEMRGGTANCTVKISDGEEIANPLATEIDILLAMNGPAIDKFEKANNPKGANIAMIGKLIKETGIMTIEECDKAIEKYFTDHGKAKFNDANKAALQAGYDS